VNNEGKFIVNYVHHYLSNMLSHISSLGVERTKLLGRVWESLAPSKVIIFS